MSQEERKKIQASEKPGEHTRTRYGTDGLVRDRKEAKMKPQCGEVCASHGCTNSEGCPISTRESVEKDMGVWKPAKVGKRYHAAPSYAPSHWPKTLKAWAWAVLIVTLFSMLAGFVVGVMV